MQSNGTEYLNNHKMNAFFKTFFASLLAVVAGGILFAVLGVMVLVGIGVSALSGSTAAVSSPAAHTVLKIDLATPVVDNPSQGALSSLDWVTMRMNRELGLLDVLGALERAESDKHIDGIYLNLSPVMPLGMATMEELRDALVKFKERSGKFVVAYSDFYTQGTSYLSSVADRLYLNPQGTLLWKGLSSNVMFYKGLLDKLGVRPEVIRHGAYKAAVEPFIMDRMSPENRRQTEELIGTIWSHVVGGIARARSLDSAALQQYASTLAIGDAALAVEKKMVDSLAYSADMEAMLAGMTGQQETRFISLEDYVMQGQVGSSGGKGSGNRIAVLYAEGDSVDGEAPEREVGGETLAAKLADLRRDEEVKAVVLRVNSPGGSALASEVIWHEMELLRAEKPVVVSMGNVAASGGYYIACPADVILASPTTITGSIGVFGLLFNAGQGLKDKLGVTVDVAKTNPSADIGLPFREVSPAERDYLQHNVERVYAGFVKHVAEGRNLTEAQVDSIGGGRVWSGVSALDNGLIDAWGGLSDAISLAADRAGVGDDFSISVPSQAPDLFTRIFTLLSARAGVDHLQNGLGELYREYAGLQKILSRQGVQAVMPYRLEIR